MNLRSPSRGGGPTQPSGATQKQQPAAELRLAGSCAKPGTPSLCPIAIFSESAGRFRREHLRIYCIPRPLSGAPALSENRKSRRPRPSSPSPRMRIMKGSPALNASETSREAAGKTLAAARAAPETKTMRPAGSRGQTSYPFRVCIRSIYPRRRLRRRRRDDDEDDTMRLVFCLAAPTVRQALSDADPQAQVLSSNAVRCATGRGRQRGYEFASPRISR